MNLLRRLLIDLQDPQASPVGFTNDPAKTTGPICWLSLGGLVTFWLELPKLSITPSVLDRDAASVITFEVK